VSPREIWCTLEPGDNVRLGIAAAGVPAGAEGVLIGWYAGERRKALVRFRDIGPVAVPADSIEPASPDEDPSRISPRTSRPPDRRP